MKFRSIKGTHDILPGEVHRWQFAEEAVRSAMHSFNYLEIRTPAFEETALFSRSIGELTDIVGKEMYTFADRSGTSLTLKPEMTASVIRAYIQNNLGEQQPLVKVYYIAPMFRQERPQAGRLRQFHQFGAEAIGSAGPAVDAEIIALSARVYESLGLRNFAVRINSVGCRECRPAYRKLLTGYLRERRDQLSEESLRRLEQNPLRILDSKDEGDRRATKDAPLMIEHLGPECSGHFEGLKSMLSAAGVTYEIDGRIVRGLDYYTKTAFEITSSDLGSQDALAGGGRYDLLVKDLGGKDTPAVGFAAGMERLLMAMEKQPHDANEPPHPTVFIASADEKARELVASLVLKLRSKGLATESDLLGRSLKSQLREANRQNSDRLIVIGSEEIEKNRVTVRGLLSKDEFSIPLDRVADELPSRLKEK